MKIKNIKEVRILLIEDDTAAAFLITEMVSDEETGTIGIEHVTSLTAGIERIRDGGIDIVLSDLGLPESRGLDTLDLLLPEVGRTLPVIVLTGLADQEIGAEAVRAGAQDYLFKEEVTGSLLVSSILYAIERKKMMVEREKLRQELEDALDQVKLLSGFPRPAGAATKNIRLRRSSSGSCW